MTLAMMEIPPCDIARLWLPTGAIEPATLYQVASNPPERRSEDGIQVNS